MMKTFFRYFFNRNRLNKKNILIFGVLIIIISTVATYTYASKIKKTTQLNGDPQVLSAKTISPETQKFNTVDVDENNNTLNILLLGYGGAGHSGGYLTDVIQVVHFDFENSKIAFISIPRDLWVTLPNGTSSKINKAFTMKDGAQTSAQMVNIITGLNINNFISIDFVGFKRAIGYELDGIKVNVPEALDDPWYPISGNEQEICEKSPDEVASLTAKYSGFELERQFECRYEHIHFDKGINYMEGGDALAYVRSRHGSAGGDFSRSERQQALLLAIRDKLFDLKALENIPGFFKQMIKHTDTNFDINTIEKLAPLLFKSKDFEIKNITLSTSNVFSSGKSSSGQYIIIPKNGNNNWTEAQNYIQSEL